MPRLRPGHFREQAKFIPFEVISVTSPAGLLGYRGICSDKYLPDNKVRTDA